MGGTPRQGKVQKTTTELKGTEHTTRHGVWHATGKHDFDTRCLRVHSNGEDGKIHTKHTQRREDTSVLESRATNNAVSVDLVDLVDLVDMLS